MFEFDSNEALLATNLPFPKRSGKVRDVYDLGDCFAIVSTDRISAFDFILPTGIPDKGRILTAMSEFWFKQLQPLAHHWLGGEFPKDRLPGGAVLTPLEGRTMIVRKAEVIPYECVVRGYLEGSGWKEYQLRGSVCGVELPRGMRQCDPLATPIFTPTTKAQQGHDEATTFQAMSDAIGIERASLLRDRSLEIFTRASEFTATRGLLLADTKFEFGVADDEVILIDEVLTPDSSRFWDAKDYHPGQSQRSFDKQFVRQWLLDSSWDRVSQPPKLPADIVNQTRAKYAEALSRLTGKSID